MADLVSKYLNDVRAFYAWMEARTAEIHRTDIEAIEAKQREARSRIDVPGLLETGLSIYGQGVGSLRDVFVPCLSQEDHAELRDRENDMVAWVSAAVGIIEGRFGTLPAQLTIRLREVASALTSPPKAP